MINMEDIFQRCNLYIIGDLEKEYKTKRTELISKDRPAN